MQTRTHFGKASYKGMICKFESAGDPKKESTMVLLTCKNPKKLFNFNSIKPLCQKIFLKTPNLLYAIAEAK